MPKDGDVLGTNKIVLNQSSMRSICGEWLKYKFNNSEVIDVQATDNDTFTITMKEREIKPDA